MARSGERFALGGVRLRCLRALFAIPGQRLLFPVGLDAATELDRQLRLAPLKRLQRLVDLPDQVVDLALRDLAAGTKGFDGVHPDRAVRDLRHLRTASTHVFQSLRELLPQHVAGFPVDAWVAFQILQRRVELLFQFVHSRRNVGIGAGSGVACRRLGGERHICHAARPLG